MIDFTKTNTVDGPRDVRWIYEAEKEGRRRRRAAMKAGNAADATKTPVKAKNDHANHQ
jgi:hypothetical protein